jgi:hypothetical protein
VLSLGRGSLFRAYGKWLRGLGLRARNRVHSVGFRAQGLRIRIQGSGFRV